MEKGMRADEQAGFKKYHKLDDNALVLLTIGQFCKLHKQDLYMCFVDLKAAYDSVPRQKLFDVLSGELGVDKSIAKCLW